MTDLARTTAPPRRATAAASEKRSLYLKRARLVAVIGVFAFYLAMLYLGTSIILPSQENDANTIAGMSVSVDEVDAFDGYAAMAFIYSVTNDISRYAIIITLSFFFIYFCLKWCRGIISISTAAFLCISPILLFLCFFVKDTIYLSFMLFCLLILTNLRNTIWATTISALFISIYAVIFRQYFAIVAVVFIGLAILKRMTWTQRAIVFLIIPIVALFIPNDIYITLQEQRDIVNYYRIGFTGSGTRTAFLNYMRPQGLYSFLVNYGYAFVRLNFPVFFGSGAKEVFLMANVFIYGALAWAGARSNDPRVWRPAMLFLAHFLTLLLFEPDLGSYLRHTGTSLPLLAPALGIWGLRNRRQPGKRNPKPLRITTKRSPASLPARPPSVMRLET